MCYSLYFMYPVFALSPQITTYRAATNRQFWNAWSSCSGNLMGTYQGTIYPTTLEVVKHEPKPDIIDNSEVI